MLFGESYSRLLQLKLSYHEVMSKPDCAWLYSPMMRTCPGQGASCSLFSASVTVLFWRITVQKMDSAPCGVAFPTGLTSLGNPGWVQWLPASSAFADVASSAASHAHWAVRIWAQGLLLWLQLRQSNFKAACSSVGLILLTLCSYYLGKLLYS